jgi:hypothetical protein
MFNWFVFIFSVQYLLTGFIIVIFPVVDNYLIAPFEIMMNYLYISFILFSLV